MTNDQGKTVVIIDGNYVDKGRLDLKLSLNLEKLKQYIEGQFTNCEFRYFNYSSIQEHFIEIVKNLGFSVNTKTTSAIKLGAAIASEIDCLGNDVDSIIIIGATNSQFFNAIGKMANKDNKKVFVYYFDERIAQSAFGPSVNLVKMNEIKAEIGITNTVAKPIPESPKTRVVHSIAENIKPVSPTIIFFDGSSLDQMQTILNKKIDYKRLIEYITRRHQPCKLRYVNKAGTDEALTHLVAQLNCSVRVEANSDIAIANEITNTLKHNKHKTDNFVIVGGYNPEYLSEIHSIAADPSKKITVYSFGELVDPAFKTGGIDWQDFSDHKKDAGIYEKETIIFIDGKGVEDWKKSIDIWLDYNELTELVKKDLKFYELRYFIDTNGDENITKKYQNLGYNVDIPSAETGSYEDRIKFQFEVMIKRPNIDNAIIVCGETPNYITDITDLSESLNKSVKFFSIKNLIEKDPEHKIVKAKPIKEKVEYTKNMNTGTTDIPVITDINEPIEIETLNPAGNICDKTGNTQKLFNTINEMLLDGTLPEIKATIRTGRDIKIEMASTKK